MILTSMAGTWVIRHAGRSEIERVRTAFGDRVITRTELDGPGFLTVLGGFLLVLPGFLTDAIGALLLLPFTRRWLGALLRRAAAGARAAAAGRGRSAARSVASRSGPTYRSTAQFRAEMSQFRNLSAAPRPC